MKAMMQESKLTNFQQRQLDKALTGRRQSISAKDMAASLDCN